MNEIQYSQGSGNAGEVYRWLVDTLGPQLVVVEWNARQSGLEYLTLAYFRRTWHPIATELVIYPGTILRAVEGGIEIDESQTG